VAKAIRPFLEFYDEWLTFMTSIFYAIRFTWTSCWECQSQFLRK